MLKNLYQRHKRLVSALALATALTLFFAVRFLTDFIYWSNHRQEPIARWMTIGYVGKSWGLNPRLLDKEAGFPLPAGHPFTLNEIAAQRGVPVSEIIKQAEAAIAKLKAEEK